MNPAYPEDYGHLMRSGLYDKLVAEGLLVPHGEVVLEARRAGAVPVLKPERIPFISYPYEWCFGQLKAAALLTLAIAAPCARLRNVAQGRSAYNVQFRGRRPVLIDTLSFRRAGAGGALGRVPAVLPALPRAARR